MFYKRHLGQLDYSMLLKFSVFLLITWPVILVIEKGDCGFVCFSLIFVKFCFLCTEDVIRYKYISDCFVLLNSPFYIMKYSSSSPVELLLAFLSFLCDINLPQQPYLSNIDIVCNFPSSHFQSKVIFKV